MRTLQHRSKYNLGQIEAVNSKLQKRSVYMKNKKMRYFKITPHCGRFLKSQSLFIKSILPGKYISFSFGPTVRIHFNLINYNFTRKNWCCYYFREILLKKYIRQFVNGSFAINFYILLLNK